MSEYHCNRRAGLAASRRTVDLAAQHEVGILPYRWSGFTHSGSARPGADRPALTR
jgi:hypothetical protein